MTTPNHSFWLPAARVKIEPKSTVGAKMTFIFVLAINVARLCDRWGVHNLHWVEEAPKWQRIQHTVLGGSGQKREAGYGRTQQQKALMALRSNDLNRELSERARHICLCFVGLVCLKVSVDRCVCYLLSWWLLKLFPINWLFSEGIKENMFYSPNRGSIWKK